MPRAGGAAAHREALRERQVGFGVDHELDALLAGVVVGGAYRSRDEPVGAPLPDPRGAGQPQPTLRLEPPQLRAVIPEEAEHRSPVVGARTEGALADGVRPHVPPEAGPDRAVPVAACPPSPRAAFPCDRPFAANVF